MSLKLKTDEIICDKCNGTGRYDNHEDDPGYYWWCNKCEGTGKLDWIEAVVGKKKSGITVWGNKLITDPIKFKFPNGYIGVK